MMEYLLINYAGYVQFRTTSMVEAAHYAAENMCEIEVIHKEEIK